MSDVTSAGSSPLFGGALCCREGLDAFCSAWQVTVIDPEPGRNDLLWPVLERALAGSAP